MSDPVCVFEWRYGSEEMRRLFSRDNIVKTYKRVELALLEALAEAGIAPREAVEQLQSVLDTVTAKDVYFEEKKIKHDIASLVFLLARKAGGEAARWVHFGATSYDIVDTAWALILRDALAIIKGRLAAVVEKLSSLASEYSRLPMVGRTHGQHAVPITLGFKFANYVYEFARSYERLCQLERRLLRVKLGGAAGTMASWGGKGFIVRRKFAEKLGLEPHIISTQVAPRDGFAELAAVAAILASQLDRFALEVRELSRPEIMEVWEERGGAIGSSAMPQKKNPVTAERISGIARFIRSLLPGFMENIVLWHERDLSNSSFERISLPHLLLALDQALADMVALLERLRFSPENMKKNLHLEWGTVVAEKLMNMLIERGLTREEAYKLSQKAAARALAEKRPLWQVAAEMHEVSKRIDEKTLEKELVPEKYVGPVERLVEDAVRYAVQVVERC